MTTEKAKAQALRQSDALRQNGLTGRWEVPTQQQADRADKMFTGLGITNITVKWSEMVDEHLVRAIADMACFLEFTKPPLLDEDSAVEAMEQLGYELGLAASETKDALRRSLVDISAAYGDRAAFVGQLPEALGLD